MSEQKMLAIRFTPSELRLLDWLVGTLPGRSRGHAVRLAIMAMGRYLGCNAELMFNAKRERAEVRDRTSPHGQGVLEEPADVDLTAGPVYPATER